MNCTWRSGWLTSSSAFCAAPSISAFTPSKARVILGSASALAVAAKWTATVMRFSSGSGYAARVGRGKQVAPQGKRGHLGDVVQVELAHQVLAVLAHRLHA